MMAIRLAEMAVVKYAKLNSDIFALEDPPNPRMCARPFVEMERSWTEWRNAMMATPMEGTGAMRSANKRACTSVQEAPCLGQINAFTHVAMGFGTMESNAMTTTRIAEMDALVIARWRTDMDA